MAKVFSKKLVLASVASLIIGVGVTVVAFAAIPDSNTKVITACRNNFSGALKAIDAQNGATCGLFETSLSWSGDLTPSSSGGAKTAVFHLTEDSSDPDFAYVYNPDLSRGIVGVKKLVANNPINNPTDNRGYCLDLDFKILYSNEIFGFVYYPAILEGTSINIDDVCGTGFDVLVGANINDKKAIFFSE